MGRIAKITFLFGADRGRVVPVTGTVLTIGRADDNDLVLPGADEHHCRIELLSRGYVIIDLGTGSGTYVNGIRVQETVLRNGDRVGVGSDAFVFDEASTELPAVRMSRAPAERWQGEIVSMSADAIVPG